MGFNIIFFSVEQALIILKFIEDVYEFQGLKGRKEGLDKGYLLEGQMLQTLQMIVQTQMLMCSCVWLNVK